MPLTLIVAAFLLAVFLKRYRRRFFWIGLGLLLFFSNDFIANAVMQGWEYDAIPINSIDSTCRLGIVLTGTTIEGLKPDDRVYFQRGADRLIHTVQLYKEGKIKTVLISGGTGRLLLEGEPEADKLAFVMKFMGVVDSDIITENESRNTHESAVEVKSILDSLHIPSQQCLLITSAFHMRRSLGCFHRMGLNPKPFSVDFYAHNTQYTPDVLFVPNVNALEIWQKLFKEWLGITAYWAAGYI